MKAAISIPAQRKPDPVSRAAYCQYLARTAHPMNAGKRGADFICRERYPDDRQTLALIEGRAAIAGAQTNVAGWAAELTYSATGTFLESLGTSAASKLVPKGMQVPFPPGASSVKLPIRPSGAVAAAVLGEGSPIPVRAHTFGVVSLIPRKLGCLIVASREVATPETVFRRLLEEDAAITLDSHVFGTAAGGLLNGVSAITPGAGQGGYAHQILADLGILARAAQVSGGSGETVFVAAPGAAGQVAVSIPDIPIYASNALPAGRVIGIDAQSLAWGFGGTPEIDVVIDATLHMDSVPLNIATGAQGSGVLATPTQSMFQTDQIAMRMLIDVAVARRTAGGVAYCDTFNWATAP